MVEAQQKPLNKRSVVLDAWKTARRTWGGKVLLLVAGSVVHHEWQWAKGGLSAQQLNLEDMKT